jgi:hypothetical protein
MTPIGYPDYGNIESSIANPSLDSGELASRMGSPNKIQRSGLVLYSDDFSNGIESWKLKSMAVDIPICRVREGNVSGSYLSLLCSSNPVVHVWCTKSIPFISMDKFALEFGMRSETDGLVTSPDITITIGVYTDTLTTVYTILINSHTNTLNVEDLSYPFPYSRPIYTFRSTSDGYKEYNSWQWYKLFIDPLNSKYIRLMYNNSVFDLSKMVLTSAPSSVAPQIYLHLDVVNCTKAYYTNFSPIIVTTGEK